MAYSCLNQIDKKKSRGSTCSRPLALAPDVCCLNTLVTNHLCYVNLNQFKLHKTKNSVLY